MTSNTTFRRAADRIRQSAFVMPMFAVYLTLLIIATILMREDIMTSYWGYDALPTEKGYAITAYAIALLPSIGQLATGYITIALSESDNDRRYAFMSGMVWIALFLTDCYSDLYFRNGFSWGVDLEIWITSAFQTIALFTLGSELFFVLGFGMVFELLPDAIVESFSIKRRVESAWQQKLGRAENRQHNRRN